MSNRCGDNVVILDCKKISEALQLLFFPFESKGSTMFDISWGEIIIVGGVAVALTGRRDLPAVCRYAGTKLGRVVGLLQGARARADQFAGQNELRQLQNELRSGLRELDQVKTELAIAASSQGVLGRTLGATTSSANRVIKSTKSAPIPSSANPSPLTNPISNNQSGQPALSSSPHKQTTELPPVAQTERAVIEEEWEKQGIGFRSRAEQGLWMDDSTGLGATKTGSELLENIIKQNLIFDQYDRVVGEQESQMEERIEDFKQKRKKKKDK